MSLPFPHAPIIHRFAAFTTDPSGGNPAGVVVVDALPPEAQMQRIAAEVGYSETAFLAPLAGEARTFRTRFFSPQAEVPFCGHASIAAGVLLAESLGPGRFVLRINGGDVPVDVVPGPDGRTEATLTSVPPAVTPVPADLYVRAMQALGWDELDLDPALPPAVGYAGAHHLILAVRERSTLAGLDYDFDGLRSAMLDHDLTTVQLVWRETPHGFRSRNPFPVAGVIEDPATGASAAALGAYLRSLGAVPDDAEITIRQGEEMGRPSILTVRLVAGEPEIRVSGTAVPIPAPAGVD